MRRRSLRWIGMEPCPKVPCCQGLNATDLLHNVSIAEASNSEELEDHANETAELERNVSEWKLVLRSGWCSLVTSVMRQRSGTPVPHALHTILARALTWALMLCGDDSEEQTRHCSTLFLQALSCHLGNSLLWLATARSTAKTQNTHGFKAPCRRRQ